MSKRKRRTFTSEFKSEAVRLCADGKQSIADVCRELEVSEGSLRHWISQAAVDAGTGAPDALTTLEREELSRLRRENKRLQLEREILKAAATFFAKESE